MSIWEIYSPQRQSCVPHERVGCTLLNLIPVTSQNSALISLLRLLFGSSSCAGRICGIINLEESEGKGIRISFCMHLSRPSNFYFVIFLRRRLNGNHESGIEPRSYALVHKNGYCQTNGFGKRWRHL